MLPWREAVPCDPRAGRFDLRETGALNPAAGADEDRGETQRGWNRSR